MSDITKKIHSIEPETGLPEGRIKLKPLPEPPVEREVPEFVTRRNDLNPTLYKPAKSGQGFLWAGITLALIWLCLGVALLFTRGLDVVQSWGTFEYILVGTVILLPAMLILFLAMTLKRLSQTSTDALRLSDISAQLLKADEHAADSVTSLASAIRSSLNALDNDIIRLNTNLAHMKDESTSHATQLNEATNYALKSSESVAQNFASQKETFSTAHHTLEETLSKLNTEFDNKKAALLKLTEETKSVTEASAETVDAKLKLMSERVTEIAAKDAETSQKFAELDSTASKALQDIEDKVQQLDRLTQKLNAENGTFDLLLEKRSKELSELTELNQMTETTFAAYLERGQTLFSELQSVTQAADETLGRHLTAFKTEMTEAKTQSDQTLAALNNKATETFDAQRAKTQDLEENLDRLKTNVADLEKRLDESSVKQQDIIEALSNAEDLTRKSRQPIGLRPLKSETEAPAFDNFVTDTKESIETPPSDMAEKISLQKSDTLLSQEGKNPSSRKSLFGSSPEVSEPLELNEEDIIMPQPELDNDGDDPFTLQILDEGQDLLKPLSDNSASLFGRKKETHKPKAQWRWRDMLGGFDSREDASEDASLSIADSSQDTSHIPPSSKRPFENMIETMGIDPERAVSEQLISEIATTFVTDDTLVKIMAINGLPDLSKYIKAHAQYGQAYQNSAALYEAKFLKNINPEIMNKDAIHSALSTEDGRHFLISLLG